MFLFVCCLFFKLEYNCFGEGNNNPLQYSCLENSHGQRSLADYSLWGCKELDMTEANEHA